MSGISPTNSRAAQVLAARLLQGALLVLGLALVGHGLSQTADGAVLLAALTSTGATPFLLIGYALVQLWSMIEAAAQTVTHGTELDKRFASIWQPARVAWCAGMLVPVGDTQQSIVQLLLLAWS